MAVTWKALAYSSEVTSAVASEGVVRSSADSSLAVQVGSAGTSAAVSTADSKAVSAASIALSYTNSEGVIRSAADSSLTVTVAAADSKAVSAATLASSQNTSQAAVLSAADSSLTVRVNSAATSAAASTADSKAVVADSKAVSAASIALSYTNSEAVIRSTADSSLTVKAINTFGPATGNVGMSGNQLTDMVIHSVSNTTSLTALTPVVAKLAFNAADLSAYICTSAI